MEQCAPLFIIDQFLDRVLYINKDACGSHIEKYLGHIINMQKEIKFFIRYLSKDSVLNATNFLSKFRNNAPLEM